MHLTLNEILNLEKLFRVNLINSISGFKSANLIATKSKNHIENVAIFSSVVHYGSNPPIFGFVTRPTTVPRDTYTNIKESKFFTINHIHQSFFKEAHHTSAKYPHNISEFDKTQLSPEYLTGFFAPFVKESKIKIGLELIEEHKIQANNTILILGEVKHLFIKDECIEKDGLVDLTKVNTATINGLDAYAFPESLERLDYQRPKK